MNINTDKIYDELNEKASAFGGAKMDTVVAKITEDGKRSFKIYRMKPDGKSYARDIADKYGLSYDCRDKFKWAMNRLKEEKVDIFLGNHMQHNHTEEKALKVKNGDVYAFVNPEEWKEYNLWCIKNMENMINRENEKHN